MSSLTDFLTTSETDARAKAGLMLSRGMRDYGHNLTGEVNRSAARGTFLSGGLGQRTDWLRQHDLADVYGDTTLDLQQTLNNLAYQRIIAASGLGG